MAALGHLSRPVIASGDAVSLPVAIVAAGAARVAAAGRARALCRRAGRSSPRTGTRAACRARAGGGDRGHRRRRLHHARLAVPDRDHPGHAPRPVTRRAQGTGRPRARARPAARTTCSPRPRAWPPPPTRCCARSPRRSATPSSAGPTSTRATQAGDRSLAARAIARAALATTAAPPRPGRREGPASSASSPRAGGGLPVPTCAGPGRCRSASRPCSRRRPGRAAPAGRRDRPRRRLRRLRPGSGERLPPAHRAGPGPPA